MYKTCFLLEPGEDPFALTGERALNVLHECMPAAVGYVQTRALPDQEAPAFSGVAEFWFEQPEKALAAARSSIGSLLQKEARVHSVFAGLERVVMQVPAYLGADRIKGVYPFCRRQDLSLDEFRHYWWHHHGPIAALTDEALSYHQIHPIEAFQSELSPRYDGITEISWLDAAAAGRAIGSRQMREDQGTDAPNFVDMESIALFLAKEETVLAP